MSVLYEYSLLKKNGLQTIEKKAVRMDLKSDLKGTEYYQQSGGESTRIATFGKCFLGVPVVYEACACTAVIYLDREDDELAKKLISKAATDKLREHIRAIEREIENVVSAEVTDVTPIVNKDAAVKKILKEYKEDDQEININFFDFPVKMSAEDALDVYREVMLTVNGDAVVKLKNVKSEKNIVCGEEVDLCPEKLKGCLITGSLKDFLHRVGKLSGHYRLYRLMDPKKYELEDETVITSGVKLDFIW